MFAVPQDQVVRLHASSGTTGKPTVVGYTQNDIDTWANVVARSIRAAGGRKGDKVHVSYGYGLFTGGLGAHYGAERLGCTVIPMSGGQTEKQVQLIRDFQPDIIMVTPSYMLNLADEIERQGIDPTTSLRLGIFGAEPWTDELRRPSSSAWASTPGHLWPVGNHGPGRRHGMHRDQGRPDHLGRPLLPRDHRPGDRRVLPDGQLGELVFTSLSKEALPMVRYRTRDLTRLLPGTAGRCGASARSPAAATTC
jgi:phenylacetate-CoA ligase